MPAGDYQAFAVSVRDPETIPPFIRLDTVHVLIVDHHLRPTEPAITYRLPAHPGSTAGPTAWSTP